MSYTPTTWKAGDTVTSAKLNKMEQGIANSGETFIVTPIDNLDLGIQTLSKTWQEIYSAASAHKDIKIIDEHENSIEYNLFYRMYLGIDGYTVQFISFNMNEQSELLTYISDTIDEYPHFVSNQDEGPIK